MPEVFSYPMTYPAWWMDYYFYATWFLGMLFLAAGWALFFLYGKFSYGVDLGCLWKTAVLILMTTISLGGPMYYNTRFLGEHGKDGDSIRISAERLEYRDRKGVEKSYPLADIKAIHQELITYNPPPKIYIVLENSKARDSLFVTKNMADYKRFLAELSKRTGIEAKLR
ncbi:MAG: hypothetical protein WCH05_06370 [Chlorobiaceae bacterium]